MAFDINSTGDVIAVSPLKQANISTPASATKMLVFNDASAISIKDSREDNAAEKKGSVEPTDVTILDKSAEFNLTMAKASPDGVAWAAAFCFGDHSVSQPVGGQPIYRHLSALKAYPTEPAYFTAIHRRGGAGGTPAACRRYSALGIGAMKFTGKKNDFLELALTGVGTGAGDNALFHETITAYDDATSITISKVAQGGTNAEKAAGITLWADMDGDGVYEKPCAISAYAAKVLTITSLGGAHANIKYRASYMVDKTESGYTWLTQIDSIAAAEEFYLKAANIQLRLGVGVSTPATPTVGTTGQTALCEVEEFSWNVDWNASPGRCWRVGSSASDLATTVDLGAVKQTVTLNRKVRDFLLDANFDENTAIGLYFDAIGPVIDTGISPTETFFVKVFLPRMKLLTADYQTADGKWLQAGTLVVLKDLADGGSMPSAMVQVQNEQSTYLA